MNAYRQAQIALDIITNDGEWPSPEHETGPQAARAAAMKDAIERLAQAVMLLAGDDESVR